MRIGMLLLVGAVSFTTASGALAECADFDQSHAAFTEILARRVDAEGRVDYAALLKEDKKALGDYIATLEACTKPEFDAWSRENRMAFLINSYNAYTLRLITKNYPTKSIRSLTFIPGQVFKKKWIKLKVLGKGPVSLNQIEHKNLRPKYKDPRVHFAVNCASVSCPQLRAEAFVGEKLDAQLDEMGVLFLNDSTKNRVDGKNVKLSMIFKWFSEDFKGAGGTAKFGAKYAEGDFKAALEGKPSISYLTYDWSLNKQ